MEEKFQLRFYGKLTLPEQNLMTAEDRGWWLRRTEEELKKRAEAEKKAADSARSRGRRR